MNTNGRRLWMHAAGMFTGMLFLGMACETTVFASGTVPADASGQITALVETVPADVLQEDTVQEPESEADVLTTEGTDAASAKEQTEEIQKAARTAVEEQVKAAQEAAAAQAKAVSRSAESGGRGSSEGCSGGCGSSGAGSYGGRHPRPEWRQQTGV